MLDWVISLFTSLNWAFVLMYVLLLAAAFALAFDEPSLPWSRKRPVSPSPHSDRRPS